MRLFACYNDGIIIMLQKYFEMKKHQCRDALEIYKRYLVRMEKIQNFFKVAENVSQTRFNTADMVSLAVALSIGSHQKIDVGGIRSASYLYFTETIFSTWLWIGIWNLLI